MREKGFVYILYSHDISAVPEIEDGLIKCTNVKPSRMKTLVDNFSFDIGAFPILLTMLVVNVVLILNWRL